MSIHSCIGFIYYIVVGAAKKAALCGQPFAYYAFVLAGKLSSTSIKKMQPNPNASHSVKGEPSTSVLMMAAVTGSAKL